MPSPSSAIEYRPTPHLILIIILFVFPLIYLCGRLFLVSCYTVGFVLKWMFMPVLQLLYGNELISKPPFTQKVPRANAIKETQVEKSSDEQVNSNIRI